MQVYAPMNDEQTCTIIHNTSTCWCVSWTVVVTSRLTCIVVIPLSKYRQMSWRIS